MADYGEWLHPGFPRIGAIELFRRNVEDQLDSAQAALDLAVARGLRPYRGAETSTQSSTRAALRPMKMRKGDDAALSFGVYFDKSEYNKMFKHLQGVAEEEMKENMAAALDTALWETQSTIEDMPRKFKGKLDPNESASGDLYYKIADALSYFEVGSKGNQFFSYEVGVDDSISGRDGDTDLIELTEDGTGGFYLERRNRKYVRSNPAKRFKGAV